jgi:hypothetical protein
LAELESLSDSETTSLLQNQPAAEQ